MSAVTEKIATWSPEAQDFAQRLRALILTTAEETETGPLTETLKWGEPAFLTEATKSGTTIRLGYKPDSDPPGRIYVHCGTTLVDSYRAEFANDLTFEGNRAVCLPADLRPLGPIRACIAMALTYHRNRRAAHG